MVVAQHRAFASHLFELPLLYQARASLLLGAAAAPATRRATARATIRAARARATTRAARARATRATTRVARATAIFMSRLSSTGEAVGAATDLACVLPACRERTTLKRHYCFDRVACLFVHITRFDTVEYQTILRTWLALSTIHHNRLVHYGSGLRQDQLGCMFSRLWPRVLQCSPELCLRARGLCLRAWLEPRIQCLRSEAGVAS